MSAGSPADSGSAAADALACGEALELSATFVGMAGALTTAYQQVEQWDSNWQVFQSNPLAWSDLDGYSSPPTSIGNAASAPATGPDASPSIETNVERADSSPSSSDSAESGSSGSGFNVYV